MDHMTGSIVQVGGILGAPFGKKLTLYSYPIGVNDVGYKERGGA